MGSFPRFFVFYGTWNGFLDIVSHLSDWKRGRGIVSKREKSRFLCVLGDGCHIWSSSDDGKEDSLYVNSDLYRGSISSSTLLFKKYIYILLKRL